VKLVSGAGDERSTFNEVNEWDRRGLGRAHAGLAKALEEIRGMDARGGPAVSEGKRNVDIGVEDARLPKRIFTCVKTNDMTAGASFDVRSWLHWWHALCGQKNSWQPLRPVKAIDATTRTGRSP